MRSCSSPQINTALTSLSRRESEGREEGEGACWPEPQELEGSLCSKDRMEMSVSHAF